MKKHFIILGVFLSLFLTKEAFAIQYIETIPSVVLIDSSDDSGNEYYGTGFFISWDSYILTVAHVILDENTNEPFTNIKICTINNEYSSPICKYSARVVAYEPSYDLALIVPEYVLDSDEKKTSEKVDTENLFYSYIDLADFLPEIGEKLIILGFPNASQLASITLTEGIVSGFSSNEDGYVTEIATDATINPGNSGGPAYNADERVVGVVTALSTDGLGGNYGYVISTDLIYLWFKDLADQGFLNPEFVDEVFSNDQATESLEDKYPVEEGKLIFSDVNYTNKYAVAINFLKDAGVIKGYEDGSFKPLSQLNRAELLKILVEGAGFSPSSAYKDCFPDIQDQWFSSYVCFAKMKGWISGYEDGTFKPDKFVSKAEALKMAFNVFNIDTAVADEDAYRDVRIGQWFTDYIYSAKFLGIITDEAVFFRPNAEIFRGEVSEIIFRMMNI